ncbi:MAG: 16S rRNA (guanine(966)-N(2))-methyltransferase RsmD [Caulobacteraceae bacterium]
MAPKGHSTRPTSDRARQALFNVLEHAPWGRASGGARVLDLFAGSGALGLEALSRGAGFCLFVDSDRAARAAIGANIGVLGYAARAKTLAADARTLGLAAEAFDIAFLDPPYGNGLAEASLASLHAGGWLASDALIAVERGADEAALAAPRYEILDRRRWGAACVWFLKPG